MTHFARGVPHTGRSNSPEGVRVTPLDKSLWPTPLGDAITVLPPFTLTKVLLTLAGRADEGRAEKHDQISTHTRH